MYKVLQRRQDEELARGVGAGGKPLCPRGRWSPISYQPFISSFAASAVEFPSLHVNLEP